jgi:hypothetical protein
VQGAQALYTDGRCRLILMEVDAKEPLLSVLSSVKQ